MKFYYAEYCPYGATTLSEGNKLLAFNSRAKRDAYVEDKYQYANSITRVNAVRRYGEDAVDIARMKADTIEARIYIVHKDIPLRYELLRTVEVCKYSSYWYMRELMCEDYAAYPSNTFESDWENKRYMLDEEISQGVLKHYCVEL